MRWMLEASMEMLSVERKVVAEVEALEAALEPKIEHQSCSHPALNPTSPDPVLHSTEYVVDQRSHKNIQESELGPLSGELTQQWTGQYHQPHKLHSSSELTTFQRCQTKNLRS